MSAPRIFPRLVRRRVETRRSSARTRIRGRVQEAAYQGGKERGASRSRQHRRGSSGGVQGSALPPLRAHRVVRAFSCPTASARAPTRSRHWRDLGALRPQLLIEDNRPRPSGSRAPARHHRPTAEQGNGPPVQGPDAIDDIAETVRAIERGKLKIRVRALEAERAIERVARCSG